MTPIEKLQAAMLAHQQVEIETHHQFSGGVYARSCVCVAGTLIVGKVHKHDHFVAILKGRVTIADENGSSDYAAPSIIACKAGTKRSLYFHEDAVFANFHRTDAVEIEAAEADLVEPDFTSPFLPGNKLPALEQASCHS